MYMTRLEAVNEEKNFTDFDAAVVVFVEENGLLKSNLSFLSQIKSFASVDKSFYKDTQFVTCQGAPGSRLVLAPTGALNREYDDVRIYQRAARKAIKRAVAAGSKKPLLILPDVPEFQEYKKAAEVAVLGAFQELYEAIDAREWFAKQGKPLESIQVLGVHQLGREISQKEVSALSNIEAGKIVARDIITCDPERMSPLRIVDYLNEAFTGLPNVCVSVETSEEQLRKNYPLFAAVARASFQVLRHHPAVVKIEYRAKDQSKVKEHLFFSGKGVVYDTGGADVKTGGHMRGMSRDKGGAAATAGFMYSVALSQPEHLNVTAMLALVRNSVGCDSYVSDEVIVSRAGVRVLVGNTDAEGRMAMTDLLCELKEDALKVPANVTPKLFTVATLTGHVIRAYGPYPACLDNGSARSLKQSQRISDIGAAIGEPWEVSVLRKEDYDIIEPRTKREDVIQCNTAPSSMTPRGHHFPAAFMAVASGLSQHGIESDKKLAYTHMDIAGAAEEEGSHSGSLPKVTGAPVTTLYAAFVEEERK